MKNEITTAEKSEHATPKTGLAIFDTGQFQQLCAVAEALAKTPLIPASLKGKNHEETVANCLLVTEQSHRWGMSPFAVAQCASVIHGRLMWEGKLVHAVIQSLAGINLKYDISGTGENMQVIVSGTLPGEDEPRTVEGTVKQWKTTGNGSPWSDPANYPRQLRYRGAREWSRAHNPAVMLGIVTDDEEVTRGGMRNVTPKSRLELREDYQEPETRAEKPVDPKPEKIPATGRQKKDRHKRECTFEAVAEKTSESGKTMWVCTFNIGQKVADLVTFSRTLGESFYEMDKGQAVEIIFTVGAKGNYQLEESRIIETSDTEGDLV